ncbi:MAG: hypothetical protein AAGB35_07580 [Pseudomonadota bacterium]
MNSISQQPLNLSVYSDYGLLIAILLVATSYVFAENLPLDLNLDLNQAEIDTIISRDDWREPSEEEENNWRQPTAEPEEEYRFGSKSIYEEDSRLEPVIPERTETGAILDRRKAEPNFKIRF